MVAYPKSTEVGIWPALDSMSKSNPSTDASPKGRGPVQDTFTGPKAPQRKSANALADWSLARKTSGEEPPRDNKIFFPID